MGREKDEKTYGFNRADAEALAKSIVSSDREYPEMKPRGSSSLVLFRFVLLESLSTGTAEATIKNMGGDDTETTDVLDPEGIFSTLPTDSTGLAIKQGGLYYVIQAACPS